MKRKFLIVLLAVISALCLIGFAACQTGGENITPGGSQTETPGGGGSTTPGGEEEGGSTTPGGEEQTNPAQKYTVTYDANGGEFADGNTFTQEVEANSLLTAPTQPKRTRYTFGGWAKNESGQDLWQFATDKVTGNITLYAVWQEPSASILSVEGASIEDEQILMIVPPETDKVSLANKVICSSDSSWKLYFDSMGQTEIPTRIAAGLNGSLSNGDNEFYIVVTSANQSQVNTYKLIIHRQYYATVYYFDNKSNLINTQTVLTGETFNADFTPTIAGYNFNYWQYQNGDKYQPDVIFEGLSLYANTTAKTYKITLNVNDGDELSSNEKTVTYDKSYSLPKPTRTGYTFLGWGYKNGNDLLTDNKGASLKNWTGTADTTLYAKWQINQYKVTLNKDLEAGGSVSGGGDFDYNSSCTITASTNSGYTWLGWYKGGKLETMDFSYEFTLGAAPVTYTAKWIKYPVTLERSDSAAGTVSGVEKTVLGEQTTITAETNPGYTWLGWYKENEQITPELTYTFKLEETPVTYTAKWIKVTLAKNFTDAGTITPLDKTYKAGESVTVTATTYLGYTWLGWYNDETELTTDLSYTFDMPKENVTYTAKWKVNDEMSNFIFISTQDTCIISSIKDYGVDTIIVPEYVTGINEGAFKGCSNLKKITLPFVGGSIKTEEDTYQLPFGYIFGISSYSGASAVKQYYHGYSTSKSAYNTFYIPDSLKSVTITGGNILYGAFSGCTNLTSVTIPNGVTSIGGSAFSGCTNLTSVTIPDDVISIGGYAFSGCSSLRNVNFSDNSKLKTIGDYAFYNCTSLESITIPASVTSINYEAFSSCDNLIQTESGVQYVDKWVVDCDTSVSNVNLRADTKGIADEAFCQCTSLESITIPDGVTSIGVYAFHGCTSLRSITIPTSVTSIGYRAFDGCKSLENITVDQNNKLYSSQDGILYDKNKTTLIKCPQTKTTLTIPDSVTSIENYAFYDCTSLESVTIPNSVTSIGDYAFQYCSNLSTVYYGGDITQWNSITIGNYNDKLKNATRYYYSETVPDEDKWAESENWWHYDPVTGEIAIWKKD